MGFHYDCEEIACHALSSFDVVMTWAELEGMLRSGTIAERLRTNPDETVIAGRLAETVHQHPIVGPDPQFYFDWERPEGGTQQIIVVNAAGVEAPTQAGRRIELRGVMKRFSLGGRPGTRDEYSNSVLYLKSWSYIR